MIIWWTTKLERQEVLESDVVLATYISDLIKKDIADNLHILVPKYMEPITHYLLSTTCINCKKPAFRLCRKRNGIFLAANDLQHVFYLQGFCTDLELNFINSS